MKAHEWVKALPSGPLVLCLGAIAHGKAEVFVFLVGGWMGGCVGGWVGGCIFVAAGVCVCVWLRQVGGCVASCRRCVCVCVAAG